MFIVSRFQFSVFHSHITGHTSQFTKMRHEDNQVVVLEVLEVFSKLVKEILLGKLTFRSRHTGFFHKVDGRLALAVKADQAGTKVRTAGIDDDNALPVRTFGRRVAEGPDHVLPCLAAGKPLVHVKEKGVDNRVYVLLYGKIMPAQKGRYCCVH